jgi:hypothetical protein
LQRPVEFAAESRLRKAAEIIQDEIYPSPEVVVQTEVVVQNQELEKFGHR